MSDFFATEEFKKSTFRSQFNLAGLIEKYTRISQNATHSLELSVADDTVYEVIRPGYKPRKKAEIQKELNKLNMNPNSVFSSVTTAEMTDSAAKAQVTKRNREFEKLYAEYKRRGENSMPFPFDEDEMDDAHEFPPNSQVTVLDVETQYQDEDDGEDDSSNEFDDSIDDTEIVNPFEEETNPVEPVNEVEMATEPDEEADDSIEFPDPFAQNNNNEVKVPEIPKASMETVVPSENCEDVGRRRSSRVVKPMVRYSDVYTTKLKKSITKSKPKRKSCV